MREVLNNSWTRVILFLAIAANLVACKPGEILGTIAIGAGIIAICDADPYNCESEQEYRRRKRREHRRDRRDRRHADYYYKQSVDVQQVTMLKAMTPRDRIKKATVPKQQNLNHLRALGQGRVSPKAWSKTFSMKVESSASLISALESARDGNSRPLMDIGLSSDDFVSLINMQLPTDDGIQRLAENLDESPKKVAQMLNTLISIAKEQ